MKRARIPFALTLTLALLLSTLTVPALALTFPDVDESAPYAEAVDYVSDAGIMIGDNHGNFNPDNTISRAEMAAVVCRMMGETSNLPTRSGFSDVADTSWACGYVAKAAGLGIVNGYGNGIFGPKDPLTYEQAITMIVRALGLTAEAKAQGGYPNGYLAVAGSLGLLSGISSAKGQPFTRAQVAQVIYNALSPNTSKEIDLFTELNGKTFTFSSGAGAWETELTFGSNGTFTGSYHDFDMGDTQDEYPNGTVYQCSFSGQFYAAKQIDRWTYQIQLKSMTYDNEPGEGWIDDGVRYIYTYPYGMEIADSFYVYLPGHATSDLPTSFLEWVSMPNTWGTTPSTLPFWGLFNPAGASGFYSVQ